MKTYSILLLLIFAHLPGQGLFAQTKFPKEASCKDPKFDKVVDKYLSYTVPVIDVKKAFSSQTKYVFLDAREIEEYNVSHIPNARFVGYDKFNLASVKGLSKDDAIVVYCSIGYRSEKIGNLLRKAGYKHVYNLYGSIFEWANQGYPLHDKNEKTTNLIHTYNSSWGKHVTNSKLKKVD